MNEDHNNQASQSAQPETPTPQPEPRSTIRFQAVWDSVSSFVGRRSVRTAAKATAALIVLGLSALGYRHYLLIYGNRGE